MKRDTYFDFLRGIAIILVIGIHCFSDNPLHTNLFIRQFLNCAVPIFLAISGYFIGKKAFDTQSQYFGFLKKQTARVYVPMLIWSIPWVVHSIIIGASPIKMLAYMLIGGISVFYFIPLIIQYYALTPVIQRINKLIGVGIQ